jgi:hypothetical protein
MPGNKERPHAVSRKQRRFMGMVHACQKYGICPSDEVKKVAGTIKYDDADSFASTKEKKLPSKVEDGEPVEEGFKGWLAENP